MEKVLSEIMPKDIVYMIQEYSRDTDKKQDTLDELRQIFCLNKYDTTRYFWSYSHGQWFFRIMSYIRNRYPIIYHTDRRYTICEYGDCSYNSHYYGYCYKHGQVMIKAKRLFKRVLNQLNKHQKVFPIVNDNKIFIGKAKRMGIMINGGII